LSTRGRNDNQGFTQILLEGLAADGGLSVPEMWPRVTRAKLDAMRDLPYPRLAFEILRFFADDFPGAQLKDIVERTYTKEIFGTPEITPLRTLESNFHLLACSNGPTLAFKDIALQLLGNLFENVLEREDRRLNIVGATSGDTGSSA
jgi:threonine synthase